MIVVLFRSRNRPDADLAEYARRSKRMRELVEMHPGFISIENFSGPDGEELSVEIFENDESVKAWRANPEHRETQRWAREELYSWYSVTVSEVIRSHATDLMAPKRRPPNCVAARERSPAAAP
jgi:heme-degrading monooxygenase HmoA